MTFNLLAFKLSGCSWWDRQQDLAMHSFKEGPDAETSAQFWRRPWRWNICKELNVCCSSQCRQVPRLTSPIGSGSENLTIANPAWLSCEILRYQIEKGLRAVYAAASLPFLLKRIRINGKFHMWPRVPSLIWVLKPLKPKRFTSWLWPLRQSLSQTRPPHKTFTEFSAMLLSHFLGFSQIFCMFWRAFGNIKLTLRGLLRLELSQNKSKVVKLSG